MSVPTSVTPSGFARSRGIADILHFTTNRGLLGIFHTGAVLCRNLLDADMTLQAIRFPNCSDRGRDAAWIGYVNLSISRVNNSMFDSSRNWHQHDGVWWSVLAFDVSMVDDVGVYFTTTNNTYPVVRRGTGVRGLADLFSNPVPYGYYGSKHWRNGLPDSYTTCPQAEVLYPNRVPLALLSHIYVAEPEHIDEIAGWVANYPTVPDIDVECEPDIFQ